eukprot:4431667-Alexandrium_andersonii.AAC.1
MKRDGLTSHTSREKHWCDHIAPTASRRDCPRKPLSSQLVHADVGRNCSKCCWAGPGGSSTAGAPSA